MGYEEEVVCEEKEECEEEMEVVSEEGVGGGGV